MRLLALRKQLQAGVGWIFVAWLLIVVLFWLIEGPLAIHPGLAFAGIGLALSTIVPTRYLGSQDRSATDRSDRRERRTMSNTWDDH